MQIDMRKKYQYRTRAGLPVRIYATDSGGMYPVQGAIWHSLSQRWVVELWTSEGKCFGPSTVDGKHDLIEVKEENWAYFLLYELGKCEYQYGFTSKESAEKAMEDIKLAIENYNETAVSSSYRRLIRADLIKIKNTRSESE